MTRKNRADRGSEEKKGDRAPAKQPNEEEQSMSEEHEPQEMSESFVEETEASAPVERPLDDPVAASEEGGAQSAPSESPPVEAAAAEAAFGAGAWHKDKKITALWSKAENRNSWVAVGGLGWRKLANNSDTAVVALTMLGSHAKHLNRTVNLREDGGQIKEIYVW